MPVLRRKIDSNLHLFSYVASNILNEYLPSKDI